MMQAQSSKAGRGGESRIAIDATLASDEIAHLAPVRQRLGAVTDALLTHKRTMRETVS